MVSPLAAQRCGWAPRVVGAESAPVLQARGEVSHIIRQISNGAFQFHYVK
jgi:hypothetical protein